MFTIQKSDIIPSRPKPICETLSDFLDSQSGLGSDDGAFPFDDWDPERRLISGLRDPCLL